MPLDSFVHNEAVWQYTDFGDRRQSWKQFRRLIFTRLISDDQNQMTFDFNATESLIYTNIGMDAAGDEKLIRAGGLEYLKTEAIIYLNHQRGKSELVHRSFKEFATKEQLPFYQMDMNRAYYYLMVLCHFIFETFKRDVSAELIPASAYLDTVRRRLIDFAVKTVSKGGQLIMKVTAPIYEQLKFALLWDRSMNAPPIFG